MTRGERVEAGQAKKLGLREGQRVALDHAPDGWSLTAPPDAVRLVGPRAHADVVIAFVRRPDEVSRRLLGWTRRVPRGGALWVAWPRRAGGHESDVTDVLVRDLLLPSGLVDVKVAAIDDDWSGLRFVWRVA